MVCVVFPTTFAQINEQIRGNCPHIIHNKIADIAVFLRFSVSHVDFLAYDQ